MKLLPIEIDETQNTRFHNNPECQEILKVYPGYYKKVGYNKPWIGYFATIDGEEIIGCGGFKGKPKDGRIEIAYGTFKNHEGQGIGTEICRQLVLLSLQTDPDVRITARTLPENNSSTRILKRNGFEFTGTVYDEEDGDVWEWELKKQVPESVSFAGASSA
jgi:RimJ/RimL family protein N-acetyltransferase